MRKIICLVLALVMMLGMGIEAFAWSVPDNDVFGEFNSADELEKICVKVYKESGLTEVPASLVLASKYLTSPREEGGSNGTYGDFTNLGAIYGKHFATIDDAKNSNSNEYGIITYTAPFVDVYGSDAVLSFDIASAGLTEGTEYFLYLWVDGGSYVYPDFLVAAIKKENGVIKYSPVESGTRNTYEGSGFTNIEKQGTTENKINLKDNGTVTGGSFFADKDKSVSGRIVRVSVDPETGYELDTVTVKETNSGTDVPVKDNSSFVMPDAEVTVEATFKPVSNNPAPGNPTPGNPAPSNPAPAEPEPEQDIIVVDLNEGHKNAEDEEPEEEEANPNTGAPVFGFVPAIAVLGAAVVAFRKK